MQQESARRLIGTEQVFCFIQLLLDGFIRDICVVHLLDGVQDGVLGRFALNLDCIDTDAVVTVIIAELV